MSHIDDTADEVRSLEVGTVSQLFDETTFPTTTEEVLAEFGDVEISYPTESDTLETILETSGHETYGTRDELELAILNGVRRDAVGRPRYADRGDSPHETDEHVRTQQSF
ncbi:DUF5789 family protein [Natronolimnohabitans innermongolicus]|uniref:DUF2795 domain-containing protein n=1 Tax=Natronolimnohabitans innermongolicus JCM 12255 TaxID=1227499 RepID=L9X2V7_9EURY|nr:hypothetical protein [Natronolimnohabitans innermongolicus]ELY55947.1 hypothetical protein C493_10728 [Natronolimnohabitans innermongolicus JCM 12255]